MHTTVSRFEIMRHIPEDELHAYLDQALSRSQCVEIESHLAGCLSCQQQRDGIAALRDRTTALLARLAPPRRIAPAAELLRERAEARVLQHRARWQRAAWAASLVAALGIGWLSARTVDPQDNLTSAQPAVDQTESRPLAAATPVDTASVGETVVSAAPPRVDAAPPQPQRLAASVTTVQNTSSPGRVPMRAASFAETREPIGAVLSSSRLPSHETDLSVPGLWRTLSWDGAERERGPQLHRIAGLPVMEVQVSSTTDSSGTPTMIVAQQLQSGQVIRTIEGPATDVSRLLASGRPTSESPWPTIGDSSGMSDADGAIALRRGDRILAIQGALPPDSLRAMIRRLNAGSR